MSSPQTIALIRDRYAEPDSQPPPKVMFHDATGLLKHIDLLEAALRDQGHRADPTETRCPDRCKACMALRGQKPPTEEPA